MKKMSGMRIYTKHCRHLNDSQTLYIPFMISILNIWLSSKHENIIQRGQQGYITTYYVVYINREYKKSIFKNESILFIKSV